ncbi:MAG: NlpE N-terminal domain [Bacteroidota bacterium]
MKYIAIFSLALVLASCSEQSGQGTANGTDTTATGSAVSGQNPGAPEVDGNLKGFFGTFVGDLPCPDCESIRVALSLNGNMTAIVKQKKIGAENNGAVPGMLNGTWKTNEDNTSVIVITDKGEMTFKVMSTEGLVPVEILGTTYSCEKDCVLAKTQPGNVQTPAPMSK